MPGIKSLNSIYHKRGLDFISKLLNSEVIINTPTKGVFFGFTFTDKNPTFYKKAGSITKIDRILSKYYEPAIKKIKAIPSGVKKAIPNTYMYGFEYISGDKSPLTISYIYDAINKKYIHDLKTLTEFSHKFNVNPPPILFEGMLTEEQQVKILDFVYSDPEDIKTKFNTESFSKHVLNILNVYYEYDDIDSIIFRFYPNGKDRDAFVAKLIDPHLQDMQKIQRTEPAYSNDYIYILLTELVNFIEQYSIADLDKYVYSNNTYEDNYILLMNKVYKEFITKYGTKYLDIVFNTPEYLKSSEFDINLDMIKDDEVKKLIYVNDNYKEIYKILLNSFRKKKSKTVSMFDEHMIYAFNGLVDKLNKILLRQDVFESYFPSFKEFVNPLYSLNEAEFTDTEEDNRKEVNIMVDTFDVITNAHIKLADTMNRKNNLPVILILINDKSVFSENVRLELVNKCVSEYDFIDSVYVVDNKTLRGIMDYLNPNMTPRLCATNSNLINSHLDELKEMLADVSLINMNKDLKILDVAIKSDNVKLYDIISDRDFSEFKKETPECTHSYFFKLDNIINNEK